MNWEKIQFLMNTLYHSTLVVKKIREIDPNNILLEIFINVLVIIHLEDLHDDVSEAEESLIRTKLCYFQHYAVSLGPFLR